MDKPHAVQPNPDRNMVDGPSPSERSQPRTRVVIADDSYLFRAALESILEGVDTVELVGSVDTLDGLNEAVEVVRPDVVITDIRMPPTGTDEGIQFARRLREVSPAVGVVVLSQFAEASYVLELLKSGSRGRAYLLKDRVRDIDQLLAAIEAVKASRSLIDPVMVDLLVSARSQSELSPLAELTPREREVLAEIAAGKSNRAIGQSLSLTKRAVEKHVNSVFAKLSLGSSEELSPRVAAALLFLAEQPGGTRSRQAPSGPEPSADPGGRYGKLRH